MKYMQITESVFTFHVLGIREDVHASVFSDAPEHPVPPDFGIQG